jgi:hypothetical protein
MRWRRDFGVQKDLFAPSRAATDLTLPQRRVLVPLIEALLAEVTTADMRPIARAAETEARDEDHA